MITEFSLNDYMQKLITILTKEWPAQGATFREASAFVLTSILDHSHVRKSSACKQLIEQ